MFQAITNPRLKILELSFPEGFVEHLTVDMKINENEFGIGARHGFSPLDRLYTEFVIHDNQTQIYELLTKHE